MSLHPDDPRLTAFLLGELPADEAAIIAREVAADPALALALRELEPLPRLLTRTLAPGSNTLLPRQRETIRRAARQADRAAIPFPPGTRQKSWKPWFAPLAAAAAVALAVLVFSSKPALWKSTAASQSPGSPTHPPLTPLPEIQQLPAPGPEDAGPTARAEAPADPVASPALPVLRARGTVAAADRPTLELPVQTGQASLGWVRDAIRTERKLPPRDAVRLEEILNSFPLRANGLTVVARFPAQGWHPDDRSNNMTSHAATIAIETLACPWKPSASLALVTIRGNPFSDCEIKAVFRALPAHVSRYRLLGFAPLAGQPHAPLPTRLPAKSSTSLVIEIEPSSATGDLGMIEWSVNGQAAAAVPVTRHGEAEPSDDARFAALVCSFAQWLAADPAALIDHDLLAALARECASTTMPADRTDFLQLIDQALGL